MRTIPRLLVGLLAGASLLGCGGGRDSTDAGAVGADAANSASDGGVGVIVVMETTLGDMTLRLDTATTPITTANFLQYADSGFYAGTLIHRVEDDWVIQGGGYTTGLVSTTPGAPIALEIGSLSHVHGAISMARIPSDPNSATSQWFIVDAPAQGTPPQPAQLDGDFAVFGQLIDGLDVLEAITQVAVHDVGGLGNVPTTEIVVTRVYRAP